MTYPSFEYQLLNSETYAKSFCSCCSTITKWFLNGKLPERIVVTPSATTQVVTATGKNRYLEEVVVKATTTTGA